MIIIIIIAIIIVFIVIIIIIIIIINTITTRSSFENTLLPAFQAGTDRMFAQVQESFEMGMDGLIEQGKIAHQISSSSNMDLRTQVNTLTTLILNLTLNLTPYPLP